MHGTSLHNCNKKQLTGVFIILKQNTTRKQNLEAKNTSRIMAFKGKLHKKKHYL